MLEQVPQLAGEQELYFPLCIEIPLGRILQFEQLPEQRN